MIIQALKTAGALAGLAMATALVALPASAGSTSPEGTWRIYHPVTSEPFMILKIEENNGEIEGHIVKLADGPEDAICWSCIGDLKNKPLAGMKILEGGKFDGKGWNGVLMRPATGMVAPAYFEVEPDGNAIHMAAGRGPLRVDQRWERIE